MLEKRTPCLGPAAKLTESKQVTSDSSLIVQEKLSQHDPNNASVVTLLCICVSLPAKGLRSFRIRDLAGTLIRSSET